MNMSRFHYQEPYFTGATLHLKDVPRTSQLKPLEEAILNLTTGEVTIYHEWVTLHMADHKDETFYSWNNDFPEEYEYQGVDEFQEAHILCDLKEDAAAIKLALGHLFVSQSKSDAKVLNNLFKV